MSRQLVVVLGHGTRSRTGQAARCCLLGGVIYHVALSGARLRCWRELVHEGQLGHPGRPAHCGSLCDRCGAALSHFTWNQEGAARLVKLLMELLEMCCLLISVMPGIPVTARDALHSVGRHVIPVHVPAIAEEDQVYAARRLWEGGHRTLLSQAQRNGSRVSHLSCCTLPGRVAGCYGARTQVSCQVRQAEHPPPGSATTPHPLQHVSVCTHHRHWFIHPPPSSQSACPAMLISLLGWPAAVSCCRHCPNSTASTPAAANLDTLPRL